MFEIVIAIFLLLGGFFALIAAIGVLRLPDVLTRMHASTKAGTLGSSLILIGCAIFKGDIEITVRVIAIILFLMLTAPIGAHMLGRAAAREKTQITPAEHAMHLQGTSHLGQHGSKAH